MADQPGIMDRVFGAVSSTFGGDGLRWPAADVVRMSDACKPPLYRSEVERALAYYDNRCGSYVLEALARSFPETARYMRPVTFPYVQRVVDELARALSGEWRSEVTAADGTPLGPEVQASWQKVLAGAELPRKLVQANRQAVLVNRTFARVTWDEDDPHVCVTLFTPNLVHLSNPDVDHADEIVLEIAPHAGRPRYERWTRGSYAEDGTQIAPPVVQILNHRGDVIEESPNPCVDDEGAPVIPIVDFSVVDLDSSPWPLPNEQRINAGETVNAQLTNTHHVAKLNGYGQWVASEKDGSGTKTATTRIARGPESIMYMPGFTLTHVAQQAPIADLSEMVRDYIRDASAAEGLPPGSVLPEANTASGVSLVVQRSALTEKRRDHLALLTPGVIDLLETVRIVWDTFNPGQAFGPVTPTFMPGDMHAPRTDQEQADLDTTQIRNGVSSPVRVLMRDYGLTREEALVRAAEIAAENGAQRGAQLRDAAASIMPASAKPEAPVVPKPAAAAPATDVQKTALNGAQVQSMQGVVSAVAHGQFPRESAVALLEVAFQLSHEEAERIVGSAGRAFTPDPPAQG